MTRARDMVRAPAIARFHGRVRCIVMLAVAFVGAGRAAYGQNDWQYPDPYFGLFEIEKSRPAAPPAPRRPAREPATSRPATGSTPAGKGRSGWMFGRGRRLFAPAPAAAASRP